MTEYIEREAFIDHIRKEAQGLHTKMPMDLVIEGVVNEAKAFPSADVAPVRHGRWTRIDYEPIGHDYICSVCEWRNDMASHYCPNCGAKMDKYEHQKRAG